MSLNADMGSRASLPETEDQTCGDGDICRGALPEIDRLPEVCVVNNSQGLF